MVSSICTLLTRIQDYPYVYLQLVILAMLQYITIINLPLKYTVSDVVVVPLELASQV